MNYTKTAVAIFIVLLIAAGFAAKSRADGFIALGYTVFNMHETTGEIGWSNNDIELGLGIVGSGDTKKGQQNYVYTASISKIVRPEWKILGGKNYYRIGASYVHDSVLVGDANFRLGIGLDYDVFQIEYVHFSSAGIHDTNTGIDMIQLRYSM